MAKKATFEIYEGFTKRKKKYVVTEFRTDFGILTAYCKKLFKCSEAHIFATTGYLWNGELYLVNPARPGAKIVLVAYYVK